MCVFLGGGGSGEAEGLAGSANTLDSPIQFRILITQDKVAIQ